MSKNQHGKLVGQLAVFSLNNIPPKTYNTNPEEMPWITPAPMSTPSATPPKYPMEDSEPFLTTLVIASIAVIAVVGVFLAIYLFNRSLKKSFEE